MNSRSVIFFLILFLLSCNNNKREGSNLKSADGKVISVLDGDTYKIIIEGNQTLRIRMKGIDAPEKGMPFYRASKKYLSELCFGKNIKLQISAKDIHDRYLAFSYLDDGRELSHEMIKAGYAWHFKKYNSDYDCIFRTKPYHLFRCKPYHPFRIKPYHPFRIKPYHLFRIKLYHLFRGKVYHWFLGFGVIF